MKLRSVSLLLAISTFGTLVFAQGCGSKAQTSSVAPAQDEAPPGGYYITASNPDARLSDILMRLKGRWIHEVPDPNTPNPAMMTLFATADDTLSGRLFIAGAFADVGVAATLTQTDKTFTLTLVDDELRPHDWIPKTRVFKGTWDETKLELYLKNDTGEDMRFTFNKDKGYLVSYTGNVYRCVVVPTPLPTPKPATPATTTPVAHSEILLRNIPKSKLNACGVMVDWQEEWSRMSGAE